MNSENYKIVSDAYVYYVTFTIVDWLPVFVSEKACKVVTNSLTFCNESKSLCTNAFVIMPTHIHLVVFDREYNNDRLASSLTEFRKFTGRTLSDYCDSNMPGCFSNVLRECSSADRARRFWQPGRHPVSIENEHFWKQKVDYLHENPSRKGLVKKAWFWRFSSAEWYHSDGQTGCDVPLLPIDWS